MAFLKMHNPPNPWLHSSVEYLGPPPAQPLEVYTDDSREILSPNQSPDLHFDYSLNPYRGCFHGCAYCYARPSHEYLGFGAGTDFDRRIVVKPKAPELLVEAFERKSWRGAKILFSGSTDCYQPLEASYGLTRGCLEVCLRYRNPVAIITKGVLIERDLDLLSALAQETHLTVMLSIPFWDPQHARALEPTVAPPQRRFQTLERLAQAGVPVGINAAPIIPGLNDAQIPQLLARAHDAGARFAAYSLLQLPGPVAHVFLHRLRAALPERADRIFARISETRGGQLHDPRFGHRMRGEGPYAQTIARLFEQTRQRLSLSPLPAEPTRSTFRRPSTPANQLSLF